MNGKETKMTETDFKRLMELFPHLCFNKDNYGQLIIYTGLMEDEESGDIRQMTEEDFE
jgi:hypothetical protein